MPAPSYASLVAPLRVAAVDAAWVQWGAVGFGAAAKEPARAIVDPEALILASLAFGELERRLARVVQMWLGAGCRLLSVGRLMNLARDYPPEIKQLVAGFAAEAVLLGDARWKRLAGRARPAQPVRRIAEPVSPNLARPAALMLRLRLAFGVGIKADALTFLLGRMGYRASVREIAAGTGYGGRAVRRAVQDLVAGRFVEVVPTSPTSYSAKWASWERLLGVNENSGPLWRWWHELYVVVHALVEWARAADEAEWATYVAASRLRDAFDRLAPLRGRAAVLEAPDWEKPPEEWVGRAPEWIGRLADRLRGVL